MGSRIASTIARTSTPITTMSAGSKHGDGGGEPRREVGLLLARGALEGLVQPARGFAAGDEVDHHGREGARWRRARATAACPRARRAPRWRAPRASARASSRPRRLRARRGWARGCPRGSRAWRPGARCRAGAAPCPRRARRAGSGGCARAGRAARARALSADAGRHREHDPGRPGDLQERRERDERAREERQRLLRVAVDLHHLRHDVDEERAHHQERDAHHDGGVHEGEREARRAAAGAPRGSRRASRARAAAARRPRPPPRACGRARGTRRGTPPSALAIVEPAITSPRSAASTWRSRSPSACSMSALKACSTVRPGLDERGEAAREARELGRGQRERAEVRGRPPGRWRR